MEKILESSFAQKSISNLYLNEKGADVKFRLFCDDGTTELVPAHKCVLANASKVFDAMFFGSLPEKDVVEIVDASPDEFKEFLQFFYLTDVKLSLKNMKVVARLVDKYDIQNCVETNKLTNDNVFWWYQLAILLEHQQLMENCVTKMNPLASKIISSHAFLQCDRKMLENFLKNNNLECEEIDIFEACVEWARVSCQKNGLNETESGNLRNQLGNCFQLIRFGAIPKNKIGDIFMSQIYAGMFIMVEMRELGCIATVPNFKSTLFVSEARKAVRGAGSPNQNQEESDWGDLSFDSYDFDL